MAMKMVSARVPEDQLERAQEVLEQNGQTISDLIRLVVEYTSQMGEVPNLEAQRAELRQRERLDAFREALRYFDEHPVLSIGDRDAKDLLAEARDERHGLS